MPVPTFMFHLGRFRPDLYPPQAQVYTIGHIKEQNTYICMYLHTYIGEK